jgi:hypothetical protein
LPTANAVDKFASAADIIAPRRSQPSAEIQTRAVAKWGAVMKFRFALVAACASTFALAQIHLAQAAYPASDVSKAEPTAADGGFVRMAAACITSYGNGIYQVCQGTCVRYIDGVEFLAPCLKAVEDVQAAVKKAKKH